MAAFKLRRRHLLQSAVASAFLWPIIRASVLTHDSQFAFGEWRGFPAVGRLPHGWHAGGEDRAPFAARVARAR